MLIRASIIWQQLISLHIEEKRERERERERESLQTFSSITHILFPVIIVYQESVLVITILRALYKNLERNFITSNIFFKHLN